ncbi:MAG: replicative DNA helicase [Acidimicrobiia bacterium]
MSIAEFPRGERTDRGERGGRERQTQRIPPHNVEAEASLLGAILLSKDAMSIAQERGLRSDEFYKPTHQFIFDAMRALNTAGEPIDAVTVADELRRGGQLDAVGGVEALVALQNATPSVTSAERYARIVRDTAALRRLIAVAADIAEIGFSGPDDVARALDDAESRVFDVSERNVGDTSKRLEALMADVMERLEDRASSRETITGLPTGLHDLDKILLGFQPGTLNILGARPAMGKSALALRIAVHAAQATGKPVLFFSLEMGAAELAQRVLSSEARVDSTLLRNGRVSQNDWQKIGLALGTLTVPLIIDDSPGTSVAAIRARARRTVSREGGLGLIVIDYLQLMGADDNKPENRQLEVSEISRKLKLLAREFGVPVLALSQLSRALEARTDKRPTLSDLRESGALEQDADVVMFLYRDEVYNQDSKESKGAAELNVAKHRAGPLGKVRLSWISGYTRFENWGEDRPGDEG